jgi:hypothetical protein
MKLTDDDVAREDEEVDIGEQTELSKEVVDQMVRARENTQMMGVCGGKKKTKDKTQGPVLVER